MRATPYQSRVEQPGVLSVCGEVDELSIERFGVDLDEASQDFQTDLAVLLTGVEFFPSAAVGVLTRGLKRAAANDVALVLVADSASIAGRVLRMTGIPHTDRIPG